MVENNRGSNDVFDSPGAGGSGGASSAPGAVGGHGVSWDAKSEKVPVETKGLAGLLEKCKQVIFGRKQKKLDKILELAKQKGKIKSSDVQKLLRAPRRTVARYLDELEKKGLLRQVGKAGQEVFYQLSL